MVTLSTPTFSTSRHEIAGQSVAGLAKEYGTPLYVYDLNVIEQRIADLKKFDVIRYAQKACGNIAILDRMRRRNVVVDAVSCGEIHRALRPVTRPPATKSSTPLTSSTRRHWIGWSSTICMSIADPQT